MARHKRRAHPYQPTAGLAVSDRPQAMAAAHKGADTADPAMLTWQPLAGSPDADLLPDLEVLASRSRDLNRNNGLASGATQTFKDNIVGAVLRLSAMPDYRLLGWTREQAREWGNHTEAQFRSWADTTDCDAGRSLNLLGLTLQNLGGTLTNGDAVSIPLWLPRPDSAWSTRLMNIEADRLDTPTAMRQRDNLRGGVEIDSYGAPLAYWLRKKHPGDRYGFGTWGNLMAFSPDEWERIPAFTPWGRRRVIHLHDKERTGSSRGKPLVTSVMREFHMAGKYASTELQSAVASSLIAAFLESDMDPESSAALFGEDPRGAWNNSVDQSRRIRQLQGGAIIPLPAGAKLSPFNPGRPNAGFEAFMLATLRHIAAGLNIPYELLAKDFSKTNYSSARAALLEAWRYFHGRRAWLQQIWLKPVYELWLEEAINSGRVEAPGYYENRYAYSRCRFIFAGRGWVDPVKEANAAGIRMEYGLSTLESECAEQGLDWEEVIEQRAYEQARLQELGLPGLNSEALTARTTRPAEEDDPETGEPVAEPKASHYAGQPEINVHVTVPPRAPGKMRFHRHEDGSVDMIESGDE